MGYQLIETIEVGSGGAASIEFTGIPQDGVDLQILLSGQVLTGGMNIDIRFNNNSASVYGWKRLLGTGSAASGATNASSNRFILQATGNPSSWGAFSNASIYISNYAGNTNKSVSIDAVNENNSSGAFQELYAAQFSNTSAVSSIQLIGDGGNNMAQFTTASLYKVTAD
jgi:hypothetical protein